MSGRQKVPLRIPLVRNGCGGRPSVCERAQEQSRVDPLTGGQRGAWMSLDEAIEEMLRDA